MLSGITRSVKKVFGADEDATVANPSASTSQKSSSGAKKKVDKDAVARPRPSAIDDQVGRPRPRAQEEQVARPGAPDAADASAPKTKTTKAKTPPPPPASDSITDSVTSGVKKVLGMDGDSAPAAVPSPR